MGMLRYDPLANMSMFQWQQDKCGALGWQRARVAAEADQNEARRAGHSSVVGKTEQSRTGETLTPHYTRVKCKRMNQANSVWEMHKTKIQ